jgi:hypothetical protein
MIRAAARDRQVRSATSPVKISGMGAHPKTGFVWPKLEIVVLICYV